MSPFESFEFVMLLEILSKYLIHRNQFTEKRYLDCLFVRPYTLTEQPNCKIIAFVLIE
jgi:hypothetical protein